jgi:hypothetical protein
LDPYLPSPAHHLQLTSINSFAQKQQHRRRSSQSNTKTFSEHHQLIKTRCAHDLQENKHRAKTAKETMWTPPIFINCQKPCGIGSLMVLLHQIGFHPSIFHHSKSLQG